MKRMLFLFWLFCAPVYAAEPATPGDEQAAPAGTDTPALDDEAAVAGSDAEDPADAEEEERLPSPLEDDTFIPTVQISEDLSVAFPVDI